MKIGCVSIPGRVFLAPMAGVTDSPFRAICREFGAALVYTEMVSAKGLLYNNENTRNLLSITPEERPTAVQLFGSSTPAIAEAAAIAGKMPFVDLIDINCGCPAPKIVKSGDGSALMKNPELIGEIVRAAVENAGGKPVTVKIRKGYDSNCITAVETAQIAEKSGAAAVCVHARTKAQMYSGKADWNIIGEVKKSVSIPVIGNGDVTGPEAAKQMMDETSCDAVMIGRAAWGNPWIFSRTNHYLETGELLPQPDIAKKALMAIRHAEVLSEFKGEHTAIREMRRHVSMYIKGAHGAAEARIILNKAETLADIRNMLLSFAAGAEKRTSSMS